MNQPCFGVCQLTAESRQPAQLQRLDVTAYHFEFTSPLTMIILNIIVDYNTPKAISVLSRARQTACAPVSIFIPIIKRKTRDFAEDLADVSCSRRNNVFLFFFVFSVVTAKQGLVFSITLNHGNNTWQFVLFLLLLLHLNKIEQIHKCLWTFNKKVDFCNIGLYIFS